MSEGRKVPITKKSTTKKATAKTFAVSFQGVGSLPASLTIKNGLTLGEFKKGQQLDGYEISVNGNQQKDDYTFSKGDVIRVGLKTKNG